MEKGTTVKTKKKNIILKCEKCSKTFNTSKSINEHILKQICYKKSEKSYCELCNIKFKTPRELKKHLFSKEHFDNINKINVEPIDKVSNLLNTEDNKKVIRDEKILKSLEANPYLSKADIEDLSTKGNGSGIGINFNNGNDIKVKFSVDKDKLIEENTLKKEQEEIISPVLSEDQRRVIDFIINISKSDTNDKFDKFYSLIVKLKSDIFTGIPVEIISCDKISLNLRMEYVNIMRSYRRKLINKKKTSKLLSEEINKIKSLNI